MTIAARLREERKRLGFTVAAFADALRCNVRTVQHWERGNTFPSADALATLAASGLDAAYVVTGRRAGVPIEDAAAHPERSVRALVPLIAPVPRRLMLAELLLKERLNEGS